MRTKNKVITAAVIASAGLAIGGIVYQTNTQTPTETEAKELYISFYLTEIHNYSVGDEFEYTCTIGEKQIKSGQCVSEFRGNTLDIDVLLKELEEYPDIGNGVISLYIENGESANTEILLTEDKGRYKGNTAIVKITAKVIEK